MWSLRMPLRQPGWAIAEGIGLGDLRDLGLRRRVKRPQKLLECGLQSACCFQRLALRFMYASINERSESPEVGRRLM
jgi:hypothetical protein